MLLGTLVSICAIAGFLFLLLAVKRLRHRRLGACAMHGTSALVLFLAAVAIGLLGINLLTYHRLTHGSPRSRPSSSAPATRAMRRCSPSRRARRRAGP